MEKSQKETVPFSVRLDKDLYERMSIFSMATRITKIGIIELALEEFLNKREEEIAKDRH